ncbi:MAG: hypothetical protein Q4D38_07835 [Planctomycetia bacterium]|nr:hypothetical protein [Planctomycetia bacterium]
MNELSLNMDNMGKYRYGFRYFLFGVLVFLFILYLLSILWCELVDFRTPLGSKQRTWIQDAAQSIVTEASKHNEEYRTIFIAEFAQETSGLLTDEMREIVLRDTPFILTPPSAYQKIRAGLKLLPVGVASQEEAAQLLKSRGADCILFGRCKKLQVLDGRVVGNIEYSLLDKSGTLVIDHQEFTTEAAPAETSEDAGTSSSGLSPTDEKILETIQGASWGHRLIGWVLLVLTLPIVTIVFLQKMTALQSNGVNAFVLVLYTAIDGILAYFLNLFDWSSALMTLVFVLCIVCALLYNMRIMTFSMRFNDPNN